MTTATGAHDHDVIVIGGGLTALWAAYACGKAGLRTLLVDPDGEPDAADGDDDGARAFHSALGKEDLSHLAEEAVLRWRELDPALIDASGVLLFGELTYKDGPWCDSAEAFARFLGRGVPWSSLNMTQLGQRYGFVGLPGRFMASCFHGLSGAVNLPRARRKLRERARQLGVQWVANASIWQLSVRADGVSIVGDVQGTPAVLTGRRCIVAAEEHTNAILASTGVQLDLRIAQITYEWYAANVGKAPSAAPGTWFHYRKPEEGSHLFGFSDLPWAPRGAMRIDVLSSESVVTDPGQCALGASDGAPLAASFVARHLPAHGRFPMARGAYRETSASDGIFVVGHLPATVPGHRNVAVAVTGWGSGFAPVIGEILKDLATDGTTPRDIARFALTRCGALVRVAPARPAARLPTAFHHAGARVAALR